MTWEIKYNHDKAEVMTTYNYKIKSQNVTFYEIIFLFHNFDFCQLFVNLIII